MKKLLICLMALMMLTASALAEAKIENTTTLKRSISLCTETNCYVARADDGYHLYDAQGNVLSAAYASMSVKQYGQYIEVQNVSNSVTLNCLGLLDSNGREILPLNYADFMYCGNGWLMAYVLEPTTSDIGEYKDASGNKYIVSRTDVVYNGAYIGSLSRDEYVKSYSVGVKGPYMYIKTSSNHLYWLDSQFNRLDVTGDSYVSISEFEYFYKERVVHNPTQQNAFTASCTLTPDQVAQHIWYDDATGRLLDLQGNVLASSLQYDYMTFRQNYMETRSNSLRGIMTLDGTELVAPVYKEIAYSNEGLFASGYNAVVDDKGRLSYIDESGNVTTSVEYELSSSDYKGFTYNAPIVAVKNMGKYMIITATHGELPTKYDDYRNGGARRTIITVQKDGNWGCIDMAGNIVVPFEHRNALEISADGTLVYGQNNDRKYVLYNLTYGKEGSVTDNWTVAVQSGADMNDTPVLAEGAWECICGTITNGKFCPECGTKQPEPTPTPAPVDDGSWDCACGSHNTGKFCPECGTKKPEAPVEPQCASCGYKPEGTTPKFCPECGTKF